MASNVEFFHIEDLRGGSSPSSKERLPALSSSWVMVAFSYGIEEELTSGFSILVV